MVRTKALLIYFFVAWLNLPRPPIWWGLGKDYNLKSDVQSIYYIIFGRECTCGQGNGEKEDEDGDHGLEDYPRHSRENLHRES